MNIILIPAYQPNTSLIDLIHHLLDLSLSTIVVIDDGSGPSYKDIFDTAKELGCLIVTHTKNQGKGSAIKSGMLKVSQSFKEISSFITCDADGQHIAKDVLRISKYSEEHPDALILGARDFKHKNVPFRNRIGNYFSSFYFKMVTKKTCPDTQTGLRSIPFSMLQDALEVKENHYDYEMAFLLKMAKQNASLLYLPIETVYVNQNQYSHFRPIKDSILIYKQPLKFTFASLTSAMIDLGIFTLLIYLLSSSIIEKVAIASISARLVSGIYNFLMNRLWSFRSKHNIKHQFLKYGILYVFQLLMSITLVAWIGHIFDKLVLLKIIVDGFLFFISYQIQKHWVFSHKK